MKHPRYLLAFLTIVFNLQILPLSATKAKLGISIKILKGTHEILKDYPGYEPFWGLVFAEKNVAENLYTLSTHQIKKEAFKSMKGSDCKFDFFKNSIESFFSDKENTATQNLVRQMFHEAGGTFNATNSRNNPVMQFRPEDLGRVLRLVHDNDTDYIKMQTDLKQYLLSLNLKDPEGRLFLGKDFNPFIKGLVGAVQECCELNPNPLFAPNTAQGIVLGYLLWKSNDHSDLERYFSGFLGRHVTLAAEQYCPEEFKEILRNVSCLQDSKQFAEFVCVTIYQQKYGSSFPKLSTSKSVTYAGIFFTDCVDSMMLNLVNIATYNQETARLGFAPKKLSMHSSLIAFYDQHADPSNIDHKDVNQAWTNVVQNIEGAAYCNIADPVSKQTLDIDDDCDGAIPVDVVDTNLPAKIVQINKKKFKVYKKKIRDQIYWLVPKQSGLVCCELKPTKTNVIVLMNHLFNLHLYQNIDVVFNSDFEQTYFMKICKIFDWEIITEDGETIIIEVLTGKQFTIHLAKNKHGYITIDEKLPVTKKNTIDISKLSLDKQAVCITLGFSYTDTKTNLLPVLFYNRLLDNNLRLDVIKKIVLLQDKKYDQFINNFILQFSLQEDNYYFDRLIEIYKRYNYKSIEIMFDLFILKHNKISFEYMNFYYEYLLNKSNKKHFLSLIDLASRADKAESVTFLNLAEKAITRDLFDKADVNQIISCINAALNGKTREFKINGLELAKLALEKDLFDKTHSDEIISLICLVVNSKDALVQEKALELTNQVLEKKLLDKECVTNKIISLINTSLHNNNNQKSDLRLIYLALEKELLVKECLNEIISLINNHIFNNKTDYDQNMVFCLANKAVEKELLGKEHLDEIISWINNGVFNNKDIHVQYKALVLASQAIKKELLGKEHFNEIISWINNDVFNSENRYAQEKAFELADQAIEKELLGKEHVDQILLWINNGVLNSKKIYIQKEILFLIYRTIVKKLLDRKSFNQIISFINNRILNNQDSHIQERALWLGGVLNSGNSHVQGRALWLACRAIEKKLLDKEHLDQIVLWVYNGLLNRKKTYVQKMAFELACQAIEKELFDKEYLGQIISWINNSLLNRKRTYIQKMALWLGCRAVEKELLGKEHLNQIVSWIDNDVLNSQIKEDAFEFACRAVEKELLSKEHLDQIISWINSGVFNSEIKEDALFLACRAVEKELLGKEHLGQIISWINNGVFNSENINAQKMAFQLACWVIEKELLGEEHLNQIVSWIDNGLLNSKVQEMAFELVRQAIKKELLSKEHSDQTISCANKEKLLNRSDVFRNESSDARVMLERKIGALSNTRVNLRQADFSMNTESCLQPLRQGLEQQQIAEEFNQGSQEQRLLQLPLPLQLPQEAIRQTPAEQLITFAHLRASAEDMLQRRIRSIRR